MPEEFVVYGETWKEFLPEWEHVLWTGSSIERPLPTDLQAIYDEAERYAPGSEGQLRSDILRYWILLTHGGVYVDTDMEALRSIEPLLPGIACFAGWEFPGRWINNAILGAVPGGLVMAAAVLHLAGRIEQLHRRPGVRPNVLSGPQYLTHLYFEGGIRPHLHVFPKGYFYPYLWNELERGRERFPNSYAVHHWGNMRQRKGVPR